MIRPNSQPDYRASKVIGSSVVDDSDETIKTIDDLVANPDRGGTKNGLKMPEEDPAESIIDAL